MDDDDLGICWSCQKDLDEATAVWLDGHKAIQCCRDCWGRTSVAERLSIGLRFHDRSVDGLGVQETLQLLRDALTSVGFLSRVLDEENRRN